MTAKQRFPPYRWLLFFRLATRIVQGSVNANIPFFLRQQISHSDIDGYEFGYRSGGRTGRDRVHAITAEAAGPDEFESDYGTVCPWGTVISMTAARGR